ncbi:MAG TPA: hypothetical protein PKY35_03635 [Candidatus Hydrogenedentes bacterium]|nr:hypothetical protein [Candidatus Hydrogenedentota bacterium]HOL76095.1 hypothetical protein [Candidatus Hydrogenedentota bacterium]HPO84709.1 hypothetical protein [Candidatus Hydrogenedentota bacterium]
MGIIRVIWKQLVVILVGSSLVCGAAYVANQTDLFHRVSLDISGTSGEGRIQRQNNGTFRLSYKDSNGNIYAQLYKKDPRFFLGRRDENSLIIRYDAKNPREFQPAGISLLPGLSALFLGLFGFLLIMKGRRNVLNLLRTRHESGSSKLPGSSSP